MTDDEERLNEKFKDATWTVMVCPICLWLNGNHDMTTCGGEYELEEIDLVASPWRDLCQATFKALAEDDDGDNSG